MRFMFVVCALFAGCESMEPSGDVLAAVDAAPVEAPKEEPPQAPPADEPLVPGEAPPVEDVAEEAATAEQEEASLPEVVAVLAEGDAPSEESAAEGQAPDVVSASQPRWGVRVLSTLSETIPPRAVVVLPDGSEEVVRPGSMLPQAGVVVLSIAKDVVEISEIEAQGMYASIRTRSIQALIAE